MSFLGNHVLWCAFEGPGLVRNLDCSLMKTFIIAGKDVTSLSKEERLRIAEQENNIFRALGPRWSWHIESRNVETRRYAPSAEWPTAAARLLDAERHADCVKRGTQFEMRSWLTLTQAGPLSKDPDVRDEHRYDFTRTCTEISKLLSGVMRIREANDDEMASYLASTVSTRWRNISAAGHESLCESLGSERFSRHIGVSRLGEDYVSVITLGGFPEHAHPQQLADLAKLPFEFRHVIRAIAMPRAKAKSFMTTRERKARGNAQFFFDAAMEALAAKSGKRPDTSGPKNKDREALMLADEAGDAMTQLGTRGYVSMTTVFVVWDKDLARCKDKRSELCTALERHGLVVRKETWEPVKPWLMSLPGNRKLGRRTVPMSTRNLVDMMPGTTVWQGNDCDAQLARTTGVKRPWMYTADPVPFRVNTDVPGGAAHTLVFGATGQAAKSTLANHLAFQFLAWPKAQIISLSVGRSELGPVLLNRGAAYRIGAKDSIAFQPLAFIDEQIEMIAAVEWLQMCLEESRLEVTPARSAALQKSLQLLAGEPQARRTVTALVADLKSRAPELAQALKPYTRDGYYGHIFDGNDGAALERKQWTMFDLSQLLEMQLTAAVVPAIAHLLHRVNRWFDGRPTLLVLDEFPQWLHYVALERFVIRVLDTRRKDNVRALMIAQTPGQLLQFPRLLASVKSGCATNIYGPDAKALTMASAYAEFGVTPRELEQVQDMPIGSYMLKNQVGTREFALRPGPIARALAGTDDLEHIAELHRTSQDADEMLSRLLVWKSTPTLDLAERARKLLKWKPVAEVS